MPNNKVEIDVDLDQLSKDFLESAGGTPEEVEAVTQQDVTDTEVAEEAVATEETPEETTTVEIEDPDELIEIEEEPKVDSAVDEDAIVAEATSKGWKPDGPKSAAEFLRAEPLYEEIKTRGKEIQELKATMDALKTHLDKQKEAGYKQALADLEQRKVEAIQMGDVEGVAEVEKQIADHQAPEAPQTLLPAVAQFKEKHSAWLNDPSYEAQQIREFVEARDTQLATYNLSPDEHIKIIESDLLKKFPNRFKSNRPRPTTTAVEAPTAKAPKAKTANFSDLSSEQKLVCRQFERTGVMTRDEYIKQLKDLGEL